MFRTRFTERFGVEHPIVCGGMTGLGPRIGCPWQSQGVGPG